jgi:WD40 repeat protein
LQGHSNNVRGIEWNTEIPYLLISGSWDTTVKIWDTRNATCIFTLLDHHGDVYGVALHPERPFVFASSARDTTLRFWEIVEPIYPIQVFIKIKYNEIE